MISEAFNENDIIYKKIIAEGVFNGESKLFNQKCEYLYQRMEEKNNYR